MASGYRVTLDWSLKVPTLMLLLTFGTVFATVTTFGAVKKGFMPTEDTSIILVRTEAQPDISFQAMLERQRKLADAVRTCSMSTPTWQPAVSTRRSIAARSSCN